MGTKNDLASTRFPVKSSQSWSLLQAGGPKCLLACLLAFGSRLDFLRVSFWEGGKEELVACAPPEMADSRSVVSGRLHDDLRPPVTTIILVR